MPVVLVSRNVYRRKETKATKRRTKREDEINRGALESLKSSDVERLDCLVSQGFFALDALPAIGQIMDELEK